MKIAKLSMIALKYGPAAGVTSSEFANVGNGISGSSRHTRKRLKKPLSNPGKTDIGAHHSNTPKTATMANGCLVAVRIKSIMIDLLVCFEAVLTNPKDRENLVRGHARQ